MGAFRRGAIVWFGGGPRTARDQGPGTGDQGNGASGPWFLVPGPCRFTESDPHSDPLTPRTALAALALLLALAAALAGSPYAAHHASLDVAAAARAVAREEDHVTALELAEWIRDRRPDLRILDLRSAAEFDAYHVPGAERADIESLATTPFRAGETLVLYSEGGAHAAQAWVLLRALGYERVYFLRGGLYEWLEQVVDPVLPVGDDAATRARRAHVAALSRYFGGMPSVLPRAPRDDALPLPGARAPDGDAGGSAPSLQRIRRRGC